MPPIQFQYTLSSLCFNYFPTEHIVCRWGLIRDLDRSHLVLVGVEQGPSALGPRGGSGLLGGLSVSSLHRRFIVTFRAFGSSMYRRYFS